MASVFRLKTGTSCSSRFSPPNRLARATGLGLSISYEIVTQQHGGTITVESEVGDFTEFTVRLPRSGHAVAGRIG
jgi:signal transduction histidine kinase